MFFDLLDSICKENGTTVTAVLVAVGLSKGSIRNWKNGVLPAPKLFTPVNTMFTGVLLYLNHPKTRKNTYRS